MPSGENNARYQEKAREKERLLLLLLKHNLKNKAKRLQREP